MCEFAYDQHKICREVKTSFNQLVRSVLEDIGLFSFFSISLYDLRLRLGPLNLEKIEIAGLLT